MLRFASLEEAHGIIGDSIARYNAEGGIERLADQMPAPARAVA